MQHTVQLSHLSTGILVLELKNNEKYWNRHSDSYTSRLQINPHKPTSERLNYFKYFWKALHTDIFPSGQNKLMIYVNFFKTYPFCLQYCQWRIQGRGLGGLGPPLFLDQTEARRAEKNCFGDQTPHPYLWVLMTGPALSEGVDPPLIATSYIKTFTIK